MIVMKQARTATDNLFNLDNKVILVTGAGGFLGPWVVEILTKYGATILAMDLQNRDQTEKKIFDHLLKRGYPNLNDQIFSLQFDITSEAQVSSIIKKIVKKYGRIDGLVNAAVYSRPTVSESNFANYPLKDWISGIETSLTGPFIITKEVGKQMLKQRGDRSIVFFSSIYGYGTPHPEIYPSGTNKNPWYGAAKAGLLYMTTHLAREWGPKGIRVNAIIPGGVANNIPQSKDFIKKYQNLIPLGRMAQPKDLQSAVLLLMTAEYITGEFLVVDGGFTIR